MAAVFTGLLVVPQGVQDSSVFNVPNGVNSATATFDGTVFPVGQTLIDIFFSFDNGVTFPRNAGLIANGPTTAVVTPRGTTGQYSVTYTTAQQPTNVKFRTNAPSAFSTQTTLSVG